MKPTTIWCNAPSWTPRPRVCDHDSPHVPAKDFSPKELGVWPPELVDELLTAADKDTLTSRQEEKREVHSAFAAFTPPHPLVDNAPGTDKPAQVEHADELLFDLGPEYDVSKQDADVLFDLSPDFGLPGKKATASIPVTKALNGPNKDLHLASMNKELDRLIDTAALHAAEPGQKYTFDSVKRLGGYVLHTAWVLTIKPDGTYKARLVARGDRQPSSTYDETAAQL
jgi:hypothetical protein